MKTVKIIEKEFPLREVNLIAEYEMTFLKMIPRDLKEKMQTLLGSADLKGCNLPKIHNLMYYPARIPPSASRAVTLASILDYESSISKELFLKAIGLENARELARKSGVLVTLYMADPDRELVRKMLGRDPKEITVVDPMAGGGSIPLESLRLGFRTIAGDYNPIAYLLLRATIEFPAKYGRRLLELVEKEARKFIEYAKRDLGRFYREEDKGYIFFIGAEHECGGIVPLAKHTLLSGRHDIYVKPVFDSESKMPRFEIVSEAPLFSTAICPYCNKSMSEESIRRSWVRKHIEILRELLNGNEEKVEEVPKVYILASVQLGRGKYRPADELDIARLVDASRELARCAKEERKSGGDIRGYLPIAVIPADNEVFRKVREYGIKQWYQLFNPRQLLAIYKLIKYIRERSQQLYEQYGELGVAVALYLTLALTKMLSYNNILTQWNPNSEVIRDLTGSQYALGRKVRFGYDYIESIVPYITLPWTLEASEEEEIDEEDIKSTRGGILPILRLLCTRLEGLWKDGLDAIYLWDARELDKHLPEQSVDLINVDPPYYDQHNYAGITEFFWVIIQRALRPVLNVLFPRDRVKVRNWYPENPEIPKNIEMRGKPPKRVGSLSSFGSSFKSFLEASSRVLKTNGLLVVWYAYGKLHGWEELFYRFYESGYAVTKTWQVWSQSKTRRVALQKSAFFTSMVIVARPNAERVKLLNYNDPAFLDDVKNTVESTAKFILETYELDALDEAIVVSLADGCACATRYTLVGEFAVYQNLTNMALREAVRALINYLAKRENIESLDIGTLDSVSRLYTFLLIVSTDELNVSSDFANRVAQVLRGDISTVRVGTSRGIIKLYNPAEIARLHPNTVIGKSIKLVEDIRKTFRHLGVRVAEEKVAESERTVVDLARLLIALAWNKLGLQGNERETLLRHIIKPSL